MRPPRSDSQEFMEPTQGSSVSEAPDFYLTAAGEFEPLADLRACRVVRRLKSAHGVECMLVEISPPLIGQPFGLGDKDVTLLVLSPRHAGTTMFPIDTWPFFVYAARLLANRAPPGDTFCADEIETIAWARLYRNADQAK